MYGKDTYEMNRTAVLSSAILAKAVIRRPGGVCEIAVVFVQGTRHEFYWVFRARTARSPRRSWKFVNYFGRDFNMGPKPYTDFASFVQHYAHLHQAEIISIRMLKRRQLAGVLVRTHQESIHNDWTPQGAVTPTMTERVHRKWENGRKGRYGWLR